jgi:hypothetical protein
MQAAPPPPRRLNDQVTCRVTPEERDAIESMAFARGFNSGGALLRFLFLQESTRQVGKAG